MSYLRRFAYMGLGALLVLALVVAGVSAFAQDDDEPATPSAQDDGAGTAEDNATDEAETDTPALVPDFDRGPRGDEDQYLADALGITVEELEAAEDEAQAAALEQAVAEGLITEDQAAQLQGRGLGHGFGFGLSIDKNELLADALGISVAELEAAQSEARAAKLAAMVEAGALSQEEADLIAAQEAVQGYVDQEALGETVRSAYEAAVAQALADGVITQDQADTLLETLSSYNFRFDAFGRGGRGGPGHHGGHHGPRGGGFAPEQLPNGNSVAPELAAPADA